MPEHLDNNLRFGSGGGASATFPSRASDYGRGFRSFLEHGASIRGQDYANAHMVRERFALVSTRSSIGSI